MIPVWVVAELAHGEVHPASLEALDEAADLASPALPAVVAVGPAAASATLSSLAAHGTGRIVLLETPGEVAAEVAGLAVARWLGDALPPPAAPVLFLAATPHGRALAASLAVGLDAAIVPGAILARRAPDGALDLTRPAYGGRLQASVRVPASTAAVITIQPGTLGIGPARASARGAVERHPAPLPSDLRVARTRRVLAADPRTVDLREADRIVAGGAGLGGPDGVRLLEELADLLGAAVGGSRIAVDRGWMPWDRQIGQSGRTVAPDLYLAFGISGASQHVLGMQAARTVVAVNTDRAAPLLALAHLAVVGDWRPIARALVGQLRARKDPSHDGTSPPHRRGGPVAALAEPR